MSYNARVFFSIAASVVIVGFIAYLLPDGTLIPAIEPPPPVSSVTKPSDLAGTPAPVPTRRSGDPSLAEGTPPSHPDPSLQPPKPARREFTPNVHRVRVPDTTHVYQLPFPPNYGYYVSQGFLGNHTHQKIHALDIAMPEGADILCARAGKIVHVRQDDTFKFLDKPIDVYRDRQNGITVEHEDGTIAHYGHIQKGSAEGVVGDAVEMGQLLAKCGVSNGSHLHFEVLLLEGKEYRTFPFRISTRSAPEGQTLEEGSFYMRPESESVYPINAIASFEAVDSRYNSQDSFDQFDPIAIFVKLHYSGDFPLRIEFERPYIESRIQRPIEWYESGRMAWCKLERDDTKYHAGPWRAIAFFEDQEMASVDFLVRRRDTF